MTGGKQKKAPMWKKLIKLVDLGEATSFLDHVYLGCTQHECKSNESIIDEHRKFSNHESPSGQLKSYLVGRDPTRKRSLGHMTWKNMRKSALKGIVNWHTKKDRAVIQSLNSLLMTIISRRRNWDRLETVKSMLKYCLEMLVRGTNR